MESDEKKTPSEEIEILESEEEEGESSEEEGETEWVTDSSSEETSGESENSEDYEESEDDRTHEEIDLSEATLSSGEEKVDEYDHPILPPSAYYYEEILEDKYRVIRAEINGNRYRCRHFNGFMQLLLEPFAESYFLCQAQNQYLLPDWKLHVSVHQDDYEVTWNALVDIFFGYTLLAMKMQVQETWKKFGRGFTIYMYTNHPILDNFETSFQWRPGGEVHTRKFTGLQYEPGVWMQIIDEIESSLSDKGVRTMGCEKGDFALGKFVSIRNESFVRRMRRADLRRKSDGKYEMKLKLVYPPDDCGWNSRGHKYFPLFSGTKKEWNFDYLCPEKSDSSLDAYARVSIPQVQCSVYEFDRILRAVVEEKKKGNVFVENIIKTVALTALFVRHAVNRTKAVDFLFTMFRRKDVWKKKHRKFILEKIVFVAKNCFDDETREYTSKKLNDLKKYYSKKKQSHAKRLMEKDEKK